MCLRRFCSVWSTRRGAWAETLNESAKTTASMLNLIDLIRFRPSSDAFGGFATLHCGEAEPCRERPLFVLAKGYALSPEAEPFRTSLRRNGKYLFATAQYSGFAYSTQSAINTFVSPG